MTDFNRNKCIELCDNGVEQKRLGNYKSALKYYEDAKKHDPTFSHIYNNTAKILIGLGDFDLAFLNLLTYGHLNLITPYYNLEQYELLLPYYVWNDPITKVLSLKNNLVESVCEENKRVKYIATEMNLCANAGICYAMKYKSVVEENNIDINFFKNYQDIVLGKFPNGKNIRDTRFTPMINLLGFAYIIKNILGGNYSEEEVSQLYLNGFFEPRNI